MEKSLQHPRFVSSSPASLRTHPAREKWALSCGAFLLTELESARTEQQNPRSKIGGGDVNENVQPTLTEITIQQVLDIFPCSVSSPAGELPGQLGVLEEL